MSRIKKGNYVLIQDWMVTELGLKGNELIVYAVIYGYTQAERQVYNGSLNLLAEWVSGSKQGVTKNLNSLVEKGLIGKRHKISNGVTFCEFWSVDRGATELHGGQLSCTGGGQLSCPNNIDRDILEKESIEKEPELKFGYIDENFCFLDGKLTDLKTGESVRYSPRPVEASADAGVANHTTKAQTPSRIAPESKQTRFTPPTIDECKAYCSEKGYTINNDVGPLTKSSVSQNTVYGKTVYGEMNTNSNSSNSNITKEVIKKGMDSDQGTFDLMDCSNAKPHVDAPERPVEASEASEIDNHTPQAKKRATGARSARKQKPFVPPTLEECKAYAVACGRSESDGEEYWKFYDAGDWFRPDGSPVNAWKQQYQTWKNRRRFASKPSMSQQASTFKAAPKGKYDDLPF